MSNLDSYRFQGTPVSGRPVVGELLYDKLGQAVVRKLNEDFRETPIAFTQDQLPEPGQPLAFSSTLRAIAINQTLKGLGMEIHVLSPTEIVRYWQAIPNKKSTYSDSDALIFFPQQGPNQDFRRQIIDFSTFELQEEIPLLISGLELKRDITSSNYGVSLARTERTEFLPAPWLREGARVSYDQKSDAIVVSQNGIPVFVQPKGVRSFYRNGVLNLSAWIEVLSDSNRVGRVNLFSL